MRSLVLLALLSLSTTALAVPMNLVHQGRLMDSGGIALSGDHDVDVALFDVDSGGTALWTDSFAATSFDAGYYTLDIGSGGGDADTLDGQDSADFAGAAHTHAAGDADTLDGVDSTGFATSAHTHAAGDADTLDGLDSTDFVSSQCTGGAQRATYNGHCYVRLAGNYSAVTGQAACNAIGMHLASITSLAENNFITSNFAFNNHVIGFSDVQQEGQWRWSSGEFGIAGANAQFTRWGGGEPNNSGNEDCAHFRPDGLWNDLQCTSVRAGAICERDW